MTDVKVMSVTFLLNVPRDRDRFSHGSDVPYDYISQAWILFCNLSQCDALNLICTIPIQQHFPPFEVSSQHRSKHFPRFRWHSLSPSKILSGKWHRSLKSLQPSVQCCNLAWLCEIRSWGDKDGVKPEDAQEGFQEGFCWRRLKSEAKNTP